MCADIMRLMFIMVVLPMNVAYSPATCTPLKYKFTFIFDKTEHIFKVHGIWPDLCAECTTCSYPSCCNADNITYTEPYDPTHFIPLNWFNGTATEDCTDQRKVSLFEHEFYKHASCSTDMKTTDDFLNKAIELYDSYYGVYVSGKCDGYSQLWIDLDDQYGYVGTICTN